MLNIIKIKIGISAHNVKYQIVFYKETDKIKFDTQPSTTHLKCQKHNSYVIVKAKLIKLKQN